jgi:hypothetical protein
MVQVNPAAPERTILEPQAGMQTAFLQRGETEVFYGGEAGGGKSIALLMDATRYVNEADYSAIIFRRTYPELEELIHHAFQMYTAPGIGATFNSQKHLFTFPGGGRIRFSHLQHLNDIYSHQGQAYDYIGFDELPQFPRVAYVYLFSRLRAHGIRGGSSKIKRYIRSTGNPDGPGILWVKARFIDCLEPLRPKWFLTIGDFDRAVPEGTPDSISRAFVPSIRSENRRLMDHDPHYEARLNQLPEAQKLALKYGKWISLDQPNQVIETAWWTRALEGKNVTKDGRYAIGADYAHLGADKSVVIQGKGNRPFLVESWARTRTTEFANILAERINKWGYQGHAGVDTLGPGVGVYDAILAHHPQVVDRIEPCTHKDPDYDTKYQLQYQFDNLRSQMWWKFREDMEHGRVDLSSFQSETGYFEDLHRMQEEVLAHRYEVRNGKILICSKDWLREVEQIGRSPDYADALVIWNWVRDRHGFGWTPYDERIPNDYGLFNDKDADRGLDNAFT